MREDLRSTFEALQERGALRGLELVELWDTEVHWFQFIRDEVLFDGPSPLPFDGFSLVPMSCFLDDCDRVAYGWMRNLMDPQREVNKSYSQKLDLLVSQGKPGWIGEKSAVPNRDEFERQIHSGAAIATVEDGALTANRIQPRQVPRLPEGAMSRLEDSLALIDRIGGVGSELEREGSGAEALGTVQLRYRRAQIALRTLFKNFEGFQRALAEKILQTIVRAFPDHQIEAMLGDVERYRVLDGVVLELQATPDGQVVPSRQAAIRDLRNAHYNVTLEATTGNNTLRLMELQQLAEIARLGVPVDPAVVVEKAVSARSDRERLLGYAAQQQQAAAQAAQAEQKQLAQQVQAGLTLQAKELDEKQRHNVAEEALKAREQQFDIVAKFAALIEKADEAEKAALNAELDRVEAQAARRVSGGEQRARG